MGDRKGERLAASRAGLLCNRCSWADGVGFATRRRRRAGSHAVLDLLGHSQERLLDIRRVLRRGLQEGDRKLVSEFLGNSVLHDFLGCQVGLVAHQQLVHALGRVPINLL